MSNKYDPKAISALKTALQPQLDAMAADGEEAAANHRKGLELARRLEAVESVAEGLQAAAVGAGIMDIGDVPESSKERVGQILEERSAAGTLPGDGKLNRT